VRRQLSWLQDAPRPDWIVTRLSRAALAPGNLGVTNWSACDHNLVAEGQIFAGPYMFPGGSVAGHHVLCSDSAGGIDVYVGAHAADVPHIAQVLKPYARHVGTSAAAEREAPRPR